MAVPTAGDRRHPPPVGQPGTALVTDVIPASTATAPPSGFRSGEIEDVADRLVAIVPSRPPRILLFGNYGSGNVGDEAILSRLIQLLRDRSEITVVSRDPQQIQDIHGVPAVKMGSVSALRAVARCDVFAIGGGGMFGNSMTLLPQLLPAAALVAGRAGKATAFVATGAYTSTPLWVQWMLRRLAASSRVVCVRDAESASVLDAGPDTVIVDDPAISLAPAPTEDARSLLRAAGVDFDRPRLGISLKPTRYPDRNTAQVELAAEAARWWAEHRGGQTVMLCFSAKGDNGVGAANSDEAMAQRVIDACAGSGTDIVVAQAGLVPHVLKAVVGQMDVAVAHRLHAQIFAWSMGVPVAGLSYERKSDAFLGQYELHRIDVWHIRPGEISAWLAGVSADR